MKRIILLGLFVIVLASFAYGENETRAGYIWYDNGTSMNGWHNMSPPDDFSVYNDNYFRSEHWAGQAQMGINHTLTLNDSLICVAANVSNDANLAFDYWVWSPTQIIVTNYSRLIYHGDVAQNPDLYLDMNGNSVTYDQNMANGDDMNITWSLHTNWSSVHRNGVLIKNRSYVSMAHMDNNHYFILRADHAGHFFDNIRIWQDSINCLTEPNQPIPNEPIDSTLIYPTNESTYYGNYNGSVVVSVVDLNTSATCTINDSRWTVNTSTLTTDGYFNFINNTEITGENVSLIVSCSDIEETSNLTFWFAQDTILDIYFYDEITDTILNGTNISIELVSDDFAANYSTITYNFSIYSLLPGDYEIRYEADGYDPRSYYISIREGIKHEANLYLLNSTVSDLIIITVYDQDSKPAANLTIKMQRYYVDTNSFKTVSMRTTNFEGQSVLYVELYDEYYRLQIEDTSGTVIELTDPSPFYSTTPVIRVNLEDDEFTSWKTYDDVFYNLSFVNSSGIVYARFIYSDSHNLLRSGCLKVQRITTSSITDICNNCTASTAGTLTCVIDHTANGQYKAVGLLDTDTDGSWYPVDLTYYDIFDTVTFGAEGVFFTAIVAGTMGIMGLATVVSSVILLLLGIIGFVIAGIMSGFSIGWVWYLVALGFIVIFIVRQKLQ